MPQTDAQPLLPFPPMYYPDPRKACPGGAWVGVHSASANAMAGALLEAGALPQLGAWTGLQREVAFGGNGSRWDWCNPLYPTLLGPTRATGSRGVIALDITDGRPL